MNGQSPVNRTTVEALASTERDNNDLKRHLNYPLKTEYPDCSTIVASSLSLESVEVAR